MKPLNLNFPEPKRSAKDFLLKLAPQAIDLFDFPKSILGFSTINEARRRIYAMSEETAKRKLDGLKEMLKDW